MNRNNRTGEVATTVVTSPTPRPYRDGDAGREHEDGASAGRSNPGASDTGMREGGQ